MPAFLPILAAAAPGLLKAAGSLFGGGRRRREQRAAQRQQRAAEARVNNFQYSSFDDAEAQGIVNPYANVQNPYADVTNAAADLTNPYADLRVSTQGAEFQAEQGAQARANILDALVQGGGGSASANATALAAQATDANARIAAGIDQQVVRNEALAAQGEAQRQQAFAQGEARRQELLARGNQYVSDAQARGIEYTQGLLQRRDEQRLDSALYQLGRADTRLGAANRARQNAHNQLFGGLASAAGGAFSQAQAEGIFKKTQTGGISKS